MERVVWSQKQDIGPSPRMHHALAYDQARRRVVLFGGDLLDGASAGDTWEWDGQYWTQAADTGPSPRSGHGLAFDAKDAKVVLFGGASSSGQLHGDTWQWDGSGWTQVADTGPSARTATAVAYDATRSRLVLFGGEEAASSLQGDTWEWDGQGWVKVEDAGPAARRHHAMAFDPVTRTSVLFGGDLGSGPARDTWEWGGTSWTKVREIGPGPAAAAAAAFDGNAILLFGGSTLGGAAYGDTWEWYAADWTQRQDIGPHARWGHALAWDSDRGAVVLFGGLAAASRSAAGPADLLRDTWEARAAAVPPISTLRFVPNPVLVGSTTELFVDLARPAPAEGVAVSIFAPWAPRPISTITVQPGTTTGQMTFVPPSGTTPGDYVIKARAGASLVTSTLRIVPKLVSFKLIPDSVSPGGGVIRIEVGVDQPSSSTVNVDVFSDFGWRSSVGIPAGSLTGFANPMMPPSPFGGIFGIAGSTTIRHSGALDGIVLTANLRYQ